MARAPAPKEAQDQFRRQRVAAIEKQPRFPDVFRRFMLADELTFAVDYPSGLSFCNPHSRVDDAGGIYATFLIDSQYSLLWDLYVHPAGAHCIIARRPEPEAFDTGGSSIEPATPTTAWFVAPSFEAFIYRIWLENELWKYAHGESLRQADRHVPSLTRSLQRYIDHYDQQAAPSP
ncbi:MAG TPA: hypothetical protein VKS79_04800 [Gemmataceae bacterium]|nr:hypothetical protein [Gemmataceae bacterium]